MLDYLTWTSMKILLKLNKNLAYLIYLTKVFPFTELFDFIID